MVEDKQHSMVGGQAESPRETVLLNRCRFSKLHNENNPSHYNASCVCSCSTGCVGGSVADLWASLLGSVHNPLGLTIRVRACTASHDYERYC